MTCVVRLIFSSVLLFIGFCVEGMQVPKLRVVVEYCGENIDTFELEQELVAGGGEEGILASNYLNDKNEEVGAFIKKNGYIVVDNEPECIFVVKKSKLAKIDTKYDDFIVLSDNREKFAVWRKRGEAKGVVFYEYGDGHIIGLDRLGKVECYFFFIDGAGKPKPPYEFIVPETRYSYDEDDELKADIVKWINDYRNGNNSTSSNSSSNSNSGSKKKKCCCK